MPEPKPVDVKKYNKIHFVTPEVFSGGGDIFPHFESEESKKKNLLVLSRSFTPFLEHLKTSKNSSGAKQALDAINRVQSKDRKRMKEGFVYSDSLANLDVLVLTDDASGNARQLTRSSISKLELASSPLVKSNGFKVVSTMDGLDSYFEQNRYTIEKPEFLHVDPKIVDSGFIGLERLSELFYGKGSVRSSIPVQEVRDAEPKIHLFPNQFYSFTNNRGHQQFARFDPKTNSIVQIDANIDTPLRFNKHHFKNGIFGVRPLTMKQYALMQYGLLNEDVKLIFIHRLAGSGKTILALPTAVSLALQWNPNTLNNMLPTDGSLDKDQTALYEERKRLGSAYEQIVLYKSMWGNSTVGFRPGSYEAKTEGSLVHFRDAFNKTELRQKYGMNFYDLFQSEVPNSLADFNPQGPKGPQKPSVKRKTDFKEFKLPTLNPLVDYVDWDNIRGRDLDRYFIILDEMQNDEPFQLQTTVTRMNGSSKTVALADFKQMDNLNNSPEYNAFIWGVKQSIDRPDTMVINLDDASFRDPIATFFASKTAYRRV